MLFRSDLWEKAERNIHEQKYDSAIVAYETLVSELDSIYKEINSTQVEDLRRTYSIDELELANSKEKNYLLQSTVRILSILMIVLFVCFIYLKYQKRKLIQSRIKLQNAKKMAEESVQNKSLFLSNMSHEIRTPLNALSGFSELLTSGGIDEMTRNQCNEIIQQNSKLLLDLLNDVVDVACTDIAQMSFEIKECNIIVLCQNVVNTLEGIKQTEANILFASPYPAFTIETDTVRLQQVFINLLVNATKFTKKGSIVLALDVEKEGVALFSITDTGSGIPKEQRERVFKRFEKANERVQGTGIGLSLCRDIIEHLGGKIWVDPDYEQGTRVFFTHPLKQNKLQ